MQADALARHGDEGSLYRFTCPTCAAPAFHWCVNRSGSQRSYEHRARARLSAPEKSPHGNGYHLISPLVCSEHCHCGARCVLYAGHCFTKPHYCEEHFSDYHNVGSGMPIQP
jgi:hypothetical protein